MNALKQKRKLVSCICIVVSILLLFTSWISTKESMAYDYSAYQNDIIRALENIESMALFMGASIDLNGIEKITSCALDGKLTAAETFTVCKEAPALIQVLEDSMGAFVTDTSEYQTARMYCYAYMAIFAVVVLSGIWALISAIKEKYNKSQYIYFISQIVLLVCFLAMTRMLGQKGWEVGVTFTAFLSVLLAVPMDLKEKLPVDRFMNNSKVETAVQKSQAVAQNIAQKAKEVATIESWTCTGCGTKNSMTHKFCSECGCQQPPMAKNNLQICPACGSKLEEDSCFCGNCGTKIH
ncbi:zinc ribbon domain-containing protein [Anaerotignum sp.]